MDSSILVEFGLNTAGALEPPLTRLQICSDEKGPKSPSVHARPGITPRGYMEIELSR